MLFNTLQFALFFTLVYGVYLAVNHRWQNRLLLIASYIFYGAWDWRFLSLLLVTSLIDYACGIKIDTASGHRTRKTFLIISMVSNLSILGFFKYFDFFTASLITLANRMGIAAHPHVLGIILPVGISFYTFQTMSYTIDIYRRQMKATRHLGDFLLFVSFFPQLVAGPIMRARDLLPQVLAKRTVTARHLYEGTYFIVWGLFQKMLIADTLARIVNPIFAAPAPYSGPQTLLGLYAFAFQIYGDFAGYSNIARGLGSLMGFDIMINFNLPYFSVNPAEFWQRWHISLSSWLRDYLYIPLGGNRRGVPAMYRNLLITMLLGGLWHGAAWNFVLWGGYQAFLLIAHKALSPVVALIRSRVPLKVPPKVSYPLRIIVFFHLVCLGWLFFRVHSIAQIQAMFASLPGCLVPAQWGMARDTFISIACILCFPIAVECMQYRANDTEVILRAPRWQRALFYSVILCLFVFYGASGGKQFIYFQF